MGLWPQHRPRIAAGTSWLTGSVTGVSTIDGAAISWGQNVVWGDVFTSVPSRTEGEVMVTTQPRRTTFGLPWTPRPAKADRVVWDD